MKKLNLLLFFCFSIQIGFSQQNFDKIDEHARKTPPSAERNIASLAAYLSGGAENDLEKVRAFFIWIGENIRYDLGLYFDRNKTPEEHARKQKSTQVLKTKKAVCEGYSQLFNDLCKKSGVDSEIVTGITKNVRGRVSRSEHAWNAVRLSDGWFLIDNTWGAGKVNDEKRKFIQGIDEKYFLTNPNEFLENHFPHDPLFQLRENPASFQVFNNGNLSVKSVSKLTFENINKTLDEHSKLINKIDKDIASAKRMVKFDPESAFGNYLLASAYYKLGSSAYQEYREIKTPYVDKERTIKLEQVNDWLTRIEVIAGYLRQTAAPVAKIPTGNQHYSNGKRLKRNVREFQTFLSKEKVELSKLRDWLESRS